MTELVNPHKVLQKLVRKKFRTNKKLEWWWTKFHMARRRRVWKASEQQNHRCCYCGRMTWVYDGCVNSDPKYQMDRLPGMSHYEMATADHVVASSKGGTEHPGNMVMCCMRCNMVRGNKDAFEFCNMISTPTKVKKFYQSTKAARRLKRDRPKKGERHSDRTYRNAMWLGYCCTMSSVFKQVFDDVLADIERYLQSPKRPENKLKAVYGDLIQEAA